jgi:hypothetical protein
MKNILIFFKYLVYAACTQDQRLRYSYGKIYGYHCTEFRRVGALGTDYHMKFDRNRSPQREYLTFKEFKETQIYGSTK